MDKLSKELRRRCEGIAVRERKRLGLNAFDPLSGEALAESHGVRIVAPEEIVGFTPEMRQVFLEQEQIWGFLMRAAEMPPLILMRPNQPPARRQSTLMHEMAHFLLGHREDDWAAILSGKPRPAQQEAETQYAGACLQIPEVALRWAQQVGLSFAQTRAHFNASESLLRFRCNITGIRL